MTTSNKLYTIGVMACYPLSAGAWAFATTRLFNKIKNNLNTFAWNKKFYLNSGLSTTDFTIGYHNGHVKNLFQTKPIINLNF